MKLELYYRPECGFCRMVLNTIKNLKIEEKVELRNIREDPGNEQALVEECGDTQVPTLFIDGKPMRESSEIKSFLTKTFM